MGTQGVVPDCNTSCVDPSLASWPMSYIDASLQMLGLQPMDRHHKKEPQDPSSVTLLCVSILRLPDVRHMTKGVSIGGKRV